ncbi:response regulator [Candidatus Woesearchaeota archaeon]|nr:response regulator [Candidatus Woesearchaeota archaeon]
MAKTVLVVEDSAFIGDAIRNILEPHDIFVLQEDDGNKVLDLVKSKGVDLVILDLMMPKLPGRDVLERLKNDPQTKSLPVIILSARIDHARWDPEIQACDKFIAKPFKNEDLIESVKKLLKKK